MATAAPALSENYDGPSTTWQLPADHGGTRIDKQQRVRIDRQGQTAGAEYVRFHCPVGFSALFLHPVGRAPALEELSVSLGYLGTTPGAQLAARVALPRTLVDGQPLTTVIRSTGRYQTPGDWQTLVLAELPLLVQRQARLLRAERPATPIDERGAYVDSIVLIVPGGPTGAEFWTDELTMLGVISESNIASADQQQLAGTAFSEVTVSSRGFSEGGATLFPLVLSLRDEPLEAVRQWGFSSIATPVVPTPAVFADAERRGLRLICPAPQAESARARAFDLRQIESVLCWTLPVESDASAGHPSIDAARPAIRLHRQEPKLANRPLLAEPTDDFAAWSRLTDALVLRADDASEGQFAKSRAEALPGSAAIAKIQLTRSPQAINQHQAFAPGGKASPWRDPEQLEAAVWSCVAAGAKGIWFEGSRSLGVSGEANRKAAKAVELVNLQLALVQPWLVRGDPVGMVYDADRQPAAAIFRAGRTNVVIGFKPSGGQSRATARRLIVPGVSETASAYAMTPAGLKPIDRQRTVGGVLVDLAEIGPGGMLLLTDDRRAVRDINQRISATASRAVALQQELAMLELAQWEGVVAASAQLAGATPSLSVAPAAKRMISRSKTSQTSNDFVAAYLAAAKTRRMLAEARLEVRQVVGPKNRLESSPLALELTTWPDELRLRQLLKPLPRSGNLLGGGDFEDLDQTRALGWRYTRLDGAESAAVDLTESSPAHGRRCLSITAGGQTDQPAAWVTSPEVPIPAGKLVEISGWVRFDEIENAGGSLKIVDSLGGDELAIEVDQGKGWRPFRMLRRPTEAARLKIGFVLAGAGRASIDAVMIRPINLQVSPATALAPNASAADQRK